MNGLNGYLAFYRGKQMEVWAKTPYEAEQKAAVIWKVKKTWEISVGLCVLADGTEVIHTAVD